MDKFQSVRQLVSELIAYKQSNPTKKVAFVFQGGGARAAWYGGVLEAIETEVRKQQPTVAPELRFAPDILVGNSGGALAAVAYFADLLNSGSYGRYTNRQSWLWRDLSANNEAAYKLLSNAGVLELISGSKSGGTGTILPSLNNPHMLYDKLPKVGGIGNMAEKLSPQYNFQALFKSRAVLWASWNDLTAKFHDFKTAIDNLSFPNLMAGISTPQEIQQISSALQADMNDIRGKVEIVKTDVETIKGHLSHTAKFAGLTYPDQVADAFNVPLLRDSAAVAREIGDAINHLKSQLDTLALTAANGLLAKIRTALQTLRDLLPAIINEVAAFLNWITQLVAHLDDLIVLVVTTVLMAKNHSSLMNTGGIESAIHEALRRATPVTTGPTADASAIDAAIFAHWKSRRGAKVSSPNMRAPELILLASNISAGRLTLLSICDKETKKKLAHSHTWVVELDSGNVAVSSAKLAGGVKPPPSDPMRWIFGSLPSDGLELAPESADAAVAHDLGGSNESPGGFGHVPISSGTVASRIPRKEPESSAADRERSAGNFRASRAAAVGPAASPQTVPKIVESTVSAAAGNAKVTQTVGGSSTSGAVAGTGKVGPGGQIIQELQGSPFGNPELWASGIKGTSLIAAAALTSAAIPVAFPPKLWRFTNPYGTYHHWMVDGGICDNRPVQQAVNAGADCVVSFELTPLSAAVQDIPESDDRPDIGEVASDSLLNTPMNSAFYRYLETYVAEESAKSPATGARLWRIAPGQTAVNAKAIGVYDFSGYWEGGQLRMGLLDWFMRGYLDAYAGQPSIDVWNDATDNACATYKIVAPSLGQVGNANLKESSPGFFVVDFVNNHPHPGYF